MPRTYKRITNRQNWDAEHMKNAIEEVKQGMPVKTAARIFKVPRMSLKRRVMDTNKVAKLEKKVLGSCHPVFSPEQEQELVKHILDFESRMYGLTLRDLRQLAYQLAEKNKLPHKFSHVEKAAGKDWLNGFRRRHPEISLRCPEATSAARARAFNKPVVTKFFNLLREIYTKHNYAPHRIFNVDETSISTVPGRNSRILAKKGSKQVARVTSAERGISTTAVVCVSAAGSFVPPMLIFSRKRMKAELTDGAPPGTIFACNESGWMRTEVFKQWFAHFVSFVKPSIGEPALLILDGHLSHTRNLDVILSARENFVTILCLPPHCTHKLQPLDVAVMGPLSVYLDQALEKWLNHHPGRTVTVFQISQIFCEGYLKACIPTNGINGFRKTGIFPFDPEVFSDVDFLAAEVTDQILSDLDESENMALGSSSCNVPDLSTDITNKEDNGSSETHDLYKNPEPGPSSKRDEQMNSSFTVTPQECQSFPKIQGKRNATKRKSCGSAVLTSTPYKTALEEDIKKKEAKGKTIKAKNGNDKKTLKQKKPKPQKNIKESRSNSSDSEDNERNATCLYCCEEYFTSIDGWIQCRKCFDWAHELCAGVEEDEDEFICEHCSDVSLALARVQRKIRF